MDQIDAHNPAMNDRHQTKPYPLRMGDALRAKLEDQAKDMGRSLNAEIVGRLEESFEPPKATLTDVQAKSLADEIMLMIEVKSREPERLRASDVTSLLMQIERRRIEEAEVLSAMAVAAEQEAHALYASEGESARYATAKKKLIGIRNLQNEMSYWSRLLIDAVVEHGMPSSIDLSEPEIQPTAGRRVK